MSPDESHRILLVDDDETFRASTAELLRQDGHRVDTAGDASRASDLLEQASYDLLLLDLRMPGLDGMDFLEVLRTRGQGIPVLMISGYGSIDSAVEALHLGADDFLAKPVDPDVLSARVAELLERRPADERVRESTLSGIVGRTRAMEEVFDAIRKVGPTETTVLVTGETGTGKELVARAVHDASPRAAGPFVPVNCASLAEGILESELFGHEKGAFTGAVESKKGLFEAADGGTILLDEVGDMSLRLQQRLLRVLQERQVTPVGAVRPVDLDVRVVAATHRDLEAEVEAGRFRDDLYYRLKVFQIPLPPLRERVPDIPLLVEAALARLRKRSPTGVPRACSPLAMRLLRAYEWPGNVRELFSVLESAAIRAEGTRIEAHHLPEEIRGEGDPAPGRRYSAPDSSDQEKEAILAALEEAEGVRTRAAELLGMSRTTLWRRMRDLGIED